MNYSFCHAGYIHKFTYTNISSFIQYVVVLLMALLIKSLLQNLRIIIFFISTKFKNNSNILKNFQQDYPESKMCSLFSVPPTCIALLYGKNWQKTGISRNNNLEIWQVWYNDINHKEGGGKQCWWNLMFFCYSLFCKKEKFFSNIVFKLSFGSFSCFR